MSRVRVVGIDPGPVPGLVRLDLESGRLVDSAAAQCSAGLIWDVLPGIVGELAAETRLVVAVERFVARGRLTLDQRRTMDQVAAVSRHFPDEVVERPATAVKPWATDARLSAAGLLETCHGMRHARDGARHALFAAVRDAGLPDPLRATRA